MNDVALNELAVRSHRRDAARLAEPLDDGETVEDRERDVLSGSEVEPGVFCDVDGTLIAWAYDPAGRDEEGVYVRQSDAATGQSWGDMDGDR